MSETQPKRFHAVRLSIDNLLGGVSKFGRSFKDVRATFFRSKTLEINRQRRTLTGIIVIIAKGTTDPRVVCFHQKELFLSHVTSW